MAQFRNEYEDVAQDVAILRKYQDSNESNEMVRHHKLHRLHKLQRLHSGISELEGTRPTTYVEEGVVWNSVDYEDDLPLDDHEDIHDSDLEHRHRSSLSSLDNISNGDRCSIIEAIDTIPGDMMMESNVITDDLDLRIDDLHYSE